MLLKEKCQLLLIMGVSGSGKSTIGLQLANDLGWAFSDADGFHPPDNVAKMADCIPLNDDDRAPWLAAIRRAMESALADGRHAVFTCSALKATYRTTLCAGLATVGVVYLHGDRETLMQRMMSRGTHFMKPAMLDSQLGALEPPAPGEALTIDIKATEVAISNQIQAHFGL